MFNGKWKTPQTHQTLSTLQITDVDATEWILHSGTSSHTFGNSSLFTSLTKYVGADSVMVGNGEFQPITLTGTVILHTVSGPLLLDNVLIGPKLKQNLIFITQLLAELPLYVYFSTDKVFIKHRLSGELITEGRKRGNVYMLDIQKHKAFFSNRQVAADFNTWHSRLRHCSTSVVKLLQAQGQIRVNNKSTSIQMFVWLVS